MAERKQLENFHQCTTPNLKTQNANPKHILQTAKSLLKTCNASTDGRCTPFDSSTRASYCPLLPCIHTNHTAPKPIHSQDGGVDLVSGSGSNPSPALQRECPRIKTGSWPSVGVPSPPSPTSAAEYPTVTAGSWLSFSPSFSLYAKGATPRGRAPRTHLQLTAARHHAEALACGAQQRQLHLQRLLVRVLQDQRPRPWGAHADVPKAEERSGTEVAEQQHRRGRIPRLRIPGRAPPALLQVVSRLPGRHGSRPAPGGPLPAAGLPPPAQKAGDQDKDQKATDYQSPSKAA